MLLLPISARRSPMQTGFLPLNEIATWLKSHRRNGCGYEKKKRFPFWMNISSGSRSFDPDHIIKGKFRDGIVYSQNQEEALRAFLLDGRLSCSNNAAERSIKPFVISRKNFLFCKTPSGAKATATIFSLIETAKANDLDPFKYLVYIFEKLSQDEDYDLEQLMPWTESVVSACKAAAYE